jgi:hypothetical protein
MTRVRWALAFGIATLLALWAALSATLGAWWVRRKADLELAAQQAEIRRQRAILNASADAAALKSLQNKVTKANEDANNVITSNVADIINRNTRG